MEPPPRARHNHLSQRKDASRKPGLPGRTQAESVPRRLALRLDWQLLQWGVLVAHAYPVSSAMFVAPGPAAMMLR